MTDSNSFQLQMSQPTTFEQYMPHFRMAAGILLPGHNLSDFEVLRLMQRLKSLRQVATDIFPIDMPTELDSWTIAAMMPVTLQVLPSTSTLFGWPPANTQNLAQGESSSMSNPSQHSSFAQQLAVQSGGTLRSDPPTRKPGESRPDFWQAQLLWAAQYPHHPQATKIHNSAQQNRRKRSKILLARDLARQQKSKQKKVAAKATKAAKRAADVASQTVNTSHDTDSLRRSARLREKSQHVIMKGDLHQQDHQPENSMCGDTVSMYFQAERASNEHVEQESEMVAVKREVIEVENVEVYIKQENGGEADDTTQES